MARLLDWFDDRTGYRRVLDETLHRNIAGGPRWRYAFGRALVFVFFLQMVTGLALWAGYSPSASTAWESVFHIQHRTSGGWFLRGLHYYGNQSLLILLGVYILQAIVARAYRAPREVMWWLAIFFALTVTGMSITGELLPWDEKNVAAAGVRAEIVSLTPVVGEGMKEMLIGGPELGHLSLTRFFALHAGFLPGVALLILLVYANLYRRFGPATTSPPEDPATAPYWPNQALRDAIVCAGVLTIIVGFTLAHGWGPEGGAPLNAPYDPSRKFAAARPPWYFLFLYEFLKLCERIPMGSVIGAVVVPTLIVGFFLASPFIGRSRFGHMVTFGAYALIGGAIVGLTGRALLKDGADPVFQQNWQLAREQSARARLLAQNQPMGAGGGVELMRGDALTIGRHLFSQKCSSCHRYGGEDGLGHKPSPDDPPTAPDLKGIASRAWLKGLLDPKEIVGLHYFGGTAFKEGDMVGYVKDTVTEFDDAKKKDLETALIALSAEAGLKSQAVADKADAERIALGRELLAGKKGEVGCADCHKFGDIDDPESGPDLTGYGSKKWLMDMIRDPAHDAYYGGDPKKYNMPAFGKHGNLSEREIQLLAEWLRGEWFEAPAK
jgi:ubiquinol-cytochrome c reductase cytochrome b subunit